MTSLFGLLWLPTAGAAGTALLLAVPGWWREHRERSGRRAALTERLTRVYELELRAAERRAPAATPVSAPAPGRGGAAVPDDGAGDLSAAAEAYLAGTYRRRLADQRRGVPAWAWVNPLAHGSLEDIEVIAARGLWAVGPEAVVATVAAELSARVRRDGASLRAVQEQGLQPLEDRLAAASPGTPEDDAGVARVLAAALEPWLRPPPAR
jgi:hypothetical protein